MIDRVLSSMSLSKLWRLPLDRSLSLSLRFRNAGRLVTLAFSLHLGFGTLEIVLVRVDISWLVCLFVIAKGCSTTETADCTGLELWYFEGSGGSGGRFLTFDCFERRQSADKLSLLTDNDAPV